MVTGQRVALRGLVLQTMPFLATAATPARLLAHFPVAVPLGWFPRRGGGMISRSSGVVMGALLPGNIKPPRQNPYFFDCVSFLIAFHSF